MLGPLLDGLRRSGLNVSGVTTAAAWDATQPEARRVAALMPGARSILVVGNGGGALWDALLADLAADPRHLTEEEHPLDAFVRRAVLAADAQLGDVPRRWFWAAADADVHIDFRVLAHLAGMGGPSRLGLLMHPTYGCWLGLRAACFLAADLPADEPGGPDLCTGCDAPCARACPAGALDAGRWDVDRCGEFHHESDLCHATCHARVACPVGASRRYTEEELRYHSNRREGRRALRRKLGIPDAADRFEGVGPHWGDWRKRVDVKA
jgi:epoxyqueuosine reductase QueG